MEKGKWLFEEYLIWLRKEEKMKGKGEKERYTHLNAEFQLISMRNEKTFLNDQ